MLKHKRFLILYSIALVIRLAFAVPFTHDWDGFIFSSTAKNFLFRGETPYMTVVKNDPSIYPDSDRPMDQQWFAYPPLPVFMFSAPLAITHLLNIPLTEIAENLLLKLPVIAGDLLAAWLVKKLLETKNAKLAKKAELLVLFNPLLIWISSAWGMFDVWMANFLLLFLLSLRKLKFWQAGIFVALACTTKLFPVFFLPVIGIYALRVVKDSNQRWRLFLGFLISLVVIVVPFFVTSPRGFLNQNLLMHIQRSTQGLSVPAFFDYYKNFYQLPEIPLTKISAVLMYLSMLIVFLLAFVKVKSEEGLVWAMIATYIPMLVFNKVANEQYFVLLIVLLIALLFSQTSFRFPRRIFVGIKMAATYGALIAGSLLGFHFLGFLLQGITHKQLSASANHLVFYLSRHFNLPLYTYPDSPLTYYNILATLSSLAMTPFIILGLVVVVINWRQAWILRKQISAELLDIIQKGISVFRNKSLLIGSLVTSGLIILAGFVFAQDIKAYVIQNKLFTPVSLLEEKDYQSLPEDPKVGTFYNVWWNNFSHYKDFPYGDWGKTTLTPLAGYYTSKNSYFVQHIKQMKEAKIDFALIPYHLYDRKRYLTFGTYAEKMGLYFAPMIETGDILGFDEFRPTASNGRKMLGFTPTDKTRKALESVIVSSLADNINSPALLHIEGKPAVFVYDGHWFYPSWDEKFKQALATRIVNRYSFDNLDVFLFLSSRWQETVDSVEDIIELYPVSVEEFNKNNVKADDFRQAFLGEYKEFWGKVKQEVENKIGSIWLLSTYTALDPYPENHFVIQASDLLETNVFDGEYFYSLANTWVAWRHVAEPKTIKQMWEKQVELQVERNNELGKPLFLTTTASYSDKLARPNLWFEIPQEIDGEGTYDWAWETALQHNPDYVLVTSWNEFFEGTAIEPSEEYGDLYIRKTAEWAGKFREQADFE